MTEKAKTTWKAIGTVVTIIIVAIGACGCGPADHPGAPAEGAQGKTRTLSFGGYTWRVLEERDGKALLLSEDIIEKRPYNNEYTDDSWETCTLRGYLNGEFYEKFSEADRARIVQTRNGNPDNTWGTWNGERFNTPGGNPTDDYIFLLSVPEVLKYFPGLNLQKEDDGREWYYEADERLAAEFNGSGFWWWLRSPGFDPHYAACVDSDGTVDLYGGTVNYDSGGVRPALWINL